VVLARAALVLAGAVIVSPVPAGVRHAIPKKVPPQFRYVPTRAPAGYLYSSWQGSRFGLDIYFAQRGTLPTLGFHVLAHPPYSGGKCSARGSRNTYHFGAIRVYGAATRNDQDYWRCVRGGRVTISASASPFEGPTPARRRAIAAMVASAKPLG
jgi:hypothetical protein